MVKFSQHPSAFFREKLDAKGQIRHRWKAREILRYLVSSVWHLAFQMEESIFVIH